VSLHISRTLIASPIDMTDARLVRGWLATVRSLAYVYVAIARSQARSKSRVFGGDLARRTPIRVAARKAAGVERVTRMGLPAGGNTALVAVTSGVTRLG